VDGARDPALISVVIVNYRVPHLLGECLLSLRDCATDGAVEVIVVDNNSGDTSQAMVEREFPEVAWVGLKSNLGFGKACNVGARRAVGRFLLLLNPDTVVSKDTLSTCVAFMQAHPQAGIMGPRILNPNGSLQVSCRRSFPTPLVAFYRLSGLSRLFPKSRRFGQYNLTYMDPDQSAPVDAVSGSFMFMPRALFAELGGFDEQFFMYGEDLDLCRQVHDRGFEVWYHPATQIVHFKGKSSAKRAIRSRAAFYEAMLLFSRKYRHTHEAFLPAWLVAIGIGLQAGIHIGVSLARSLTACALDVVVINAVLWAGLTLRFQLVDRPAPYADGMLGLMLALHVLLTAIYLFTFWYRGVYSSGRYSMRNALLSGVYASMAFMACVYFVQQLAFSRIAFALSAFVILFLLAGWREVLPRLTNRVRALMLSTGNVVIVGYDAAAQQLIANVEGDRTATLLGVVWPEEGERPGVFQGHAVLGGMGEIRAILQNQRVDLLLIATARPWYSHVIEALASTRVRNITIRWVAREVLAAPAGELPAVIPLHDFTVQ
jgi:GT2 family glycosyltransferase